MASKKRKWECFTCGEMFLSAPGLGGHRLHKHGIRGKSLASRYRRGEIESAYERGRKADRN